jgi:hypothetical protein
MGDKEKNEYIAKLLKKSETATESEVEKGESYRSDHSGSSEQQHEASKSDNTPAASSSKKSWSQKIMSRFGRTPEQKAQREKEHQAYTESYNKARVKQMKKKGRYAARVGVWKKKGKRFGDIDTSQLIGGMGGGSYGGRSDWDILGNSPRRKIKSRRSDWETVIGSGFGGSSSYDLLGLKSGRHKKKHSKGRRLVIRY